MSDWLQIDLTSGSGSLSQWIASFTTPPRQGFLSMSSNGTKGTARAVFALILMGFNLRLQWISKHMDKAMNKGDAEQS